MNTYILLFAVLLYLAVVNARNFNERSDTESLFDAKEGHGENTKRKHGAGQSRHKRRSWQMNYGYEYPQPPPIPFSQDRRDYDTQQQNLLPQILRLLDEISAYVRRPPPPPPPQPIYVPYPVPYPIPQNCNCRVKPTPSKPAIENRFPVMDDTNQNWGFVDSNDEVDEENDNNDGARPISFNPITPSRPVNRPTPKLDHGTSQSEEPSPPELSSAASSQSSVQGQVPGMCDVFSLSCCSGSPQQQRQCFTRVGCVKTYDNGNGCDKKRLLSIIDAYSKEYSPVN